jgi:hypothetical protein
VVDGITFDSKKEAARYQELKLMERAKEIYKLELQPKFPICIEGKKVFEYRADFRYWDGPAGNCIVEDVKGVKADKIIKLRNTPERVLKYLAPMIRVGEEAREELHRRLEEK